MEYVLLAFVRWQDTPSNESSSSLAELLVLPLSEIAGEEGFRGLTGPKWGEMGFGGFGIGQEFPI